MRNILMFLILFITILTLTSCSEESSTVTISAAASTSDALAEIILLFNEEHPNIIIDTNYGASGALKVQIEQGAPVDLFLSANLDHFNDLKNKDYFGEHHVVLLHNALALITPPDETISDIEDITELRRISIGTPESVPAGQYGQAALEWYGVWDEIVENIVYAEDVRQVLTYVELGEVDAGLVYLTDAYTSDSVEIVQILSDESHESIEYPLGLINNNDSATLFYEFLQSDEATAVFENYGFIIQ